MSSKVGAIQVVDVRGFSSLTQQIESNSVYAFINRIFECITAVVHEQGGTVKDNIGDAIFAFWEHEDLLVDVVFFNNVTDISL